MSKKRHFIVDIMTFDNMNFSYPIDNANLFYT